MDENEKKETDETPKTDANEAPKTDEAPKIQPTVTAADKFAFYMFIASLIVIAICIIITVVIPKISDAILDYKIHKEVANEDEDYDTDTSTSSSTVDDSDWDYSALEDDPSNYIDIDDYDYESQNCYDQALDYLNLIGYSRNGLIKQLQSDGYTDQAISNALYVLEKGEYVTWKSQAVKKAQQYMNTFSFSQQRLYEQLISDGFTQEEANYGVSYVFNNN